MEDLLAEQPAPIPTEGEAIAPINSPAHYWGCSESTRFIVQLLCPKQLIEGECIDVIEERGAGFLLGNAIKYLWRADKKGDRIDNLLKARWYILRWLKSMGRPIPIDPAGVFELIDKLLTEDVAALIAKEYAHVEGIQEMLGTLDGTHAIALKLKAEQLKRNGKDAIEALQCYHLAVQIMRRMHKVEP